MRGPADVRPPTGPCAGEQAYRPRRSVLYMPGSNERALEKAKTLPVDALILDLEDAVGPDHKVAAREAACAAVRSGEYGDRELTIRVNGMGTPWHEEDLAAAARPDPPGSSCPRSARPPRWLPSWRRWSRAARPMTPGSGP